MKSDKEARIIREWEAKNVNTRPTASGKALGPSPLDIWLARYFWPIYITLGIVLTLLLFGGLMLLQRLL